MNNTYYCPNCYCYIEHSHYDFCTALKQPIKQPISIPQVPKDARLPDMIVGKPEEIEAYEGFLTKDSGQRETFASRMVRDIQTDKPRYDLIGWGWKLIKRWAELVGRGAVKYGELNFEKANSQEELNRFKASALRHMLQWHMGETDEDHAAAVCFNLAGAEALKEKLNASQDK